MLKSFHDWSTGTVMPALKFVIKLEILITLNVTTKVSLVHAICSYNYYCKC